MKPNKEKLNNFIKKNDLKRKAFYEYLDDILYLKNKGITLSGILKYIFSENDIYKKKYENKKPTALNLLSKLIRDHQNIDKKEELSFSKKDSVEKKETSKDVNKEFVDTNSSKKTKQTKKVEIQLLNNEVKKCSLPYLKSDYIIDSSGQILEKNVFSFKNNYNDMDMDIKKLKDVLSENPFIENLSLVVYVDEGKSNNAFVYRLIEKEFVLLGKLSVYDFVVEMEDVERIATKKFYDNIKKETKCPS